MGPTGTGERTRSGGPISQATVRFTGGTGIGVAVVGILGCALASCAPPDPAEEQAENAFFLVDPAIAAGWTLPGQVSGDGQVVVGFSGPSAGLASALYNWTARGGARGRLVSFRPPGDIDVSSPGAVFSVGLSADASTVLGTAFRRRDDSSLSLFSWSAGAGVVDLGDLPGQRATNVRVRSNRDGQVVTATANGRAFRWSAGEGRVDLGTLPGDSASEALAISADGAVIVGNSLSADGVGRVFLWTAASGMRAVAPLPLPAPAGPVSCRTSGLLSDDGRVLFGACGVIAEAPAGWGEQAGAHYTHARLFRWTAEGGTQLIDVPAQCGNAHPWRTTSDGTVLLGWVDGASTADAAEQPSTVGTPTHGTLNGPSALFRWTARTTPGGPSAGLAVLVPPSGFGACDTPSGLSADGSFVLGACHGSAGALQGVRWDRGGVGVPLAPPPGFAESHPSSISADGMVVAGHARQRAGTTEKDAIDVAMVWDTRRPPGAQQLIDRLNQQGLLTGVASTRNQIRILTAAVSSEGHTFFGEALDARGQPASWIARLP